MDYILASLTIGFLGSFHCIGMCGPIALALPINDRDNKHKFFGILVYNFGRVLTYASLGAVIGLIGKCAATFGLQQILSIVIGGVLLLSLFAPSKFTNDIFGTGKIYQIVSKIKSRFAQLFSRKSFSSLFLIGLLNGLLPCGLVYMAIAGALSLGDFTKSIIFMATFGAATLPIMLSISFFGTWLNERYRSSIRKLIPVSVFIMAVMLIVRGLNLGIPYLSPARNLNGMQMVSCHDTKENINCVKIK